MKALSNKVAILTGQGMIKIFDLEVNLIKNASEKSFDINDCVEINIDQSDQITVMEWLRCDYSLAAAKMVVGTLMGHILIYEIRGREVELIRMIQNAHFESLTVLSECPLSNG